MAATDVAVYDHLRSTDPDDDDAVYRVVGTASGTVTLLRVSDGDGRRANTGEVLTISRAALDSFEAADNPDGNRGLLGTVRSAAGAGYWALRAGGPLLTIGVVLAVVGTLGNVGLLALSPLVVSGLIFVGFGCIVIALLVD
jgi:hypothetical protein